MEKKPYAAPVVTDHGNVVEQTKGLGGRYWEMYNPKSTSDIEDPPIPPTPPSY